MSAEPQFDSAPELRAIEGGKSPEVVPSEKVYEGKKPMRAFNQGETVRVRIPASPDGVMDTLVLTAPSWNEKVNWINSPDNIPDAALEKEKFARIEAGAAGLLYVELDEQPGYYLTQDALKKTQENGKGYFIPLDPEKKRGIFIKGWNPETRQVDIKRGWQEEEKAPVAPLPPIRQIEDYRPQPTPPVERNDAPKAPTQENEKKSPLRYLVDIAPPIGLGLGTIHGGPATISQTLHEVPQNPIPVIERPDPREPHEVPSAQIVDTRLNTVHDNEPLMATGDVLPQDPTGVTPKPFTPAPEPTPAIIPDVPSTGGGFAANVRGQIEENAANAAAQSQRFIERGNADAQNWNNQPPVTPADNTK